MSPQHRVHRRFPVSGPLLFWVVIAGLTAASLDMLYATGFWALKGVPPTRILQSIAAGVLGKASFSGGMTTAALGLVLHCLIALGMAVAYFIVARRLPLLVQRPWLCGVAYGLLLYAVMQYVVVPASAAPGGGTPNPLWIVCSIVAHALLVGLPIAWCARRAFAGSDHARPHPHREFTADAC